MTSEVGFRMVALAALALTCVVPVVPAEPGTGTAGGVPRHPVVPCSRALVVGERGPGLAVCVDDRPALARAVAAVAAAADCPAPEVAGVRAGDRITVGRGGVETCVVVRGDMGGAVRLALGMPLPIDRAGGDDFAILPGIGPALARRIVTERDAEPFASVDELVRVRGIGPRRLDALRAFFTVSDDSGEAPGERGPTGRSPPSAGQGAP